MAVTGISTYEVFQTTITDVTKTMNSLLNAQAQLSSGNKSSDFTGMADQAQQYLSLDNILSKTNQYLNDNQIVETRISTTSAVLDQTITTATSLQNLISSRRSGVTTAAFAEQLDGLWQQFANQLNTTVNNQYIFSGTKTGTAPVNPDNFPTTIHAGVPDDSYYLGSKQDLTAQPQDNTTITYNVRADASGFQKIFAGLALAKQGDASNDGEALADAFTLVQTGLQDIINTQATVNANKVQYSVIDKNLQNTKLYWQGIQESINNTDVVAVSTQVAINQGILQAAFQAFAKITSLRLSDFLR